jgi:hypothetical protein
MGENMSTRRGRRRAASCRGFFAVRYAETEDSELGRRVGQTIGSQQRAARICVNAFHELENPRFGVARDFRFSAAPGRLNALRNQFFYKIQIFRYIQNLFSKINTNRKILRNCELS